MSTTATATTALDFAIAPASFKGKQATVISGRMTLVGTIAAVSAGNFDNTGEATLTLATGSSRVRIIITPTTEVIL